MKRVVRRSRNRLVIGIDDEPEFGLWRFFYIFDFAVIDGDFVSLALRISGADSRGVQKNAVGNFFALRSDHDVTGMIFFCMQPQIVGTGGTDELVVL